MRLYAICKFAKTDFERLEEQGLEERRKSGETKA
jgi:hypothetical protein